MEKENHIHQSQKLIEQEFYWKHNFRLYPVQFIINVFYYNVMYNAMHAYWQKWSINKDEIEIR